MSISSVSTGSTTTYQASNPQKDVRTAFKQMADAINKGDLDGARNAFDNLAQLMNNGQPASQNGGQTAPSGNDLSTLLDQIGSALQSGDLDQAKQALQNLQQAAQSQSKHHHHHHGGGAEASKQGGSTTATSASSDSTAIGGINLTV